MLLSNVMAALKSSSPDELKPIKLITKAFPTICEFIEHMLTPQVSEPLNGAST